MSAAKVKFSRFRVEGLRSDKAMDVEIKDNTLILVGENGSGKTTFLRLMFYFLSGRWQALAQLQFKSICATINGFDFEILYEDVKQFSGYDPATTARLPPSARQRVRELEAMGRLHDAQMVLRRYFPTSALTAPAEAAQGKLADLHAAISSAVDSQILYLPTYRRIERELSSIFHGLDPDDLRRARLPEVSPETSESFIELVEFGMGDVDKAIHKALEAIRSFANTGLNTLTLSYLVSAQPRCRQAWSEGICEALDVTMGFLIQAPYGPASRPVVVLA